jgi:hypothetical protein
MYQVTDRKHNMLYSLHDTKQEADAEAKRLNDEHGEPATFPRFIVQDH